MTRERWTKPRVECRLLGGQFDNLAASNGTGTTSSTLHGLSCTSAESSETHRHRGHHKKRAAIETDGDRHYGGRHSNERHAHFLRIERQVLVEVAAARAKAITQRGQAL